MTIRLSPNHASHQDNSHAPLASAAEVTYVAVEKAILAYASSILLLIYVIVGPLAWLAMLFAPALRRRRRSS
jgi:hypothetical protein